MIKAWVVDTKTIIDGKCKLLKIILGKDAVDAEQKAAKYISTLPDHLSGRYGLDVEQPYVKEKQPKKLIKRIDPRKLNPKDCCFMFSSVTGKPTFRIYDRKNKSFKDYVVMANITPFVKLVSDDVELKEYVDAVGKIHRTMDFPEFALTCGKTPLLKPGEVWVAQD